MNYFLVKTDPDTYSAKDFEREGETLWDGVHNFAAIGFIKQMRPGDKVYVYESQGPKAIVGLAEVTTEPFENTEDPRPSWVVRMKYLKHFDQPLTLQTVKADPALQDFALVRQSRLSVMPVSDTVQQRLAALLK